MSRSQSTLPTPAAERVTATQPVFILGCPRSGTTLLSRLLAHTRYGSPVESHFITKYYKRLSRYGDLSVKNNFVRLVDHILQERPIMQWNLGLDVDHLYAQMERFDYREIVDRICGKRAEKHGCEAWGDKTPHYILDFRIIAELFPDSKVVYVVRDGRDVALSLLGRKWGPNNVLACAEYWKRCNAVTDFEKAREGGRVHSIRYEDLLAEPERIGQGVLAFLGEDDGLDSIRSFATEIKKSNCFKWKTTMSPRQIRWFELTAADTLKRFGYEVTHEEGRVNPCLRSVFRLHDGVMRAGGLFRQNVIDTIKIKWFGKEPFAE